MKQTNYDNQIVTIEVDDGYTISRTKPMHGRLTVDEEANTMSFTKDAQKEKTSTKNQAEFIGDHMILRPNKNGNYRLTMVLDHDTKTNEIREDLIEEFKEALNHMPVQ